MNRLAEREHIRADMDRAQEASAMKLVTTAPDLPRHELDARRTAKQREDASALLTERLATLRVERDQTIDKLRHQILEIARLDCEAVLARVLLS